ncbi:hypothetical protein CK203_079054 [Vitis vinifera]|uniref:Reverse transcriptase domain-containing protein n=1 Tax=Vitis vinifera TaxID=29760 RepID=A0A438BYL0_VITVI|nr:hypothetical protein CK203_079054 [Vitis vinifera]
MPLLKADKFGCCPYSKRGLRLKAKSVKGGIICKMDIEKAYDHVNWGFLLAILDKMGFNWMSSRGPRQGDPLSPFLVILAMEALSSIFKRALQGGFLEGFMASGRGGEGVAVSHLLFAYDTLVFYDARKACEPKVGEDSKRLPLGGRSFPKLNKALLGKWCWRFALEQDSLWKQVIVENYGEKEGGWCFGASREGYGVGLWKAIRNRWMEFSKRMAFKAFPSLYSLASSRDTWVAQLWDQSEDLGHWNPVFTRLNNDWEMEEVEAFFKRLHGQALRSDDEDVMSWRVSNKGFFTVKFFYSSLVPCIGREFPSSLVWNPWVPKRVRFFAWEAIWGRILTMDQLKRRGWILPSK